MMESTNKASSREGEITLKEIILKVGSYYRELVKNWMVIALISLPLLVYFGYKHFTYKPVYVSEVRFLVEGSTSSFGGLGGLLGQFGIRNTGKANPFKIVEVAKSKFILKKVLFEKHRGDFIANQIISLYKLDEDWSTSNPKFKDFRFKNHETEKFDSLERTAFMRIVNKVTGGINAKDPMLNFTFSEETGVFSYKANCVNEELTLLLQQKSYDYLQKFFEEDIIENSINTTVILKQKADSLQQLISTKAYQLANLQDRTLGLVMATPGVKKMTLEKEIQALTIAYAEVLKSYEISDITLKDTKPMFLMLDESMPPLEVSDSSIYINLIKALLLAGILGGGFIILRKIYRDAMS
ncbi:MAG: hypothetical protein IPN29_03910 [Saprospiraceae bacterium]|nr:hypothetical protein [Saprospiraceae bacterium]